MEKNVHLFVLSCKILNMEAQNHACFHVNFPFSAYFYPPPLHHNSKGSIKTTRS